MSGYRFKWPWEARRAPPPLWGGIRRRRRWGYAEAMLVTLGVSAGVLIGLRGEEWVGKFKGLEAGVVAEDGFTCRSPYVVDGDTLRCGSERVRLAGIDAPEMPGHCRPGRECTAGDAFASRDGLQALVRIVSHGVV